MDNNEGYSPLFYWMLLLGIVGVLGFFIVAAGAAGGLSMTNASMSVSYDTKALDALIASSDELRRILKPHRKVSERAGTMRIVGAK